MKHLPALALTFVCAVVFAAFGGDVRGERAGHVHHTNVQTLSSADHGALRLVEAVEDAELERVCDASAFLGRFSTVARKPGAPAFSIAYPPVTAQRHVSTLVLAVRPARGPPMG